MQNTQEQSQAFFTIPTAGLIGDKGNKLSLPDDITLEDGSTLTFSRPKKLGLSIGGFYKNAHDEEFMVKMGIAFQKTDDESLHALHLLARYESLINDLAEVTLDKSATTHTEVGKYHHDGFKLPCFVSSLVPNYKDISHPDFTEENKKQHRKKFHPTFAFNALITNDDIHDDNLGVDGAGNPVNIDYGILPSFLLKEQAALKDSVHHIASFIGHQGDVGKQITRKRFFGYDAPTNPLEFGRDQTIKDNDISYLDVLLGVKNICDKKEDILSKTHNAIDKISGDASIPAAVKERLMDDFQTIHTCIGNKIDYFTRHFSHDFDDIEAKSEAFKTTKWRHHPTFEEIFNEYRVIDANIAASCHEENMAHIASIIGLESKASKESILNTDFSSLNEEKQMAIKEIAAKKFFLHTAVVNNDLDMTTWLVNHDISDVNTAYRQRFHSYQHSMTTPLSTAIAMHRDAVVYDHHYHRHDQMIDFLAEKFAQRNPESLEEGYSSNQDISFVLRLSKLAHEKFVATRSDPKLLAAEKIATWITAKYCERLDGKSITELDVPIASQASR